MQTVIIHTDGGARGNPGPSGIGVAYYDEKNALMHEFSEYIGVATNNVAEYVAIVRALEHLVTLVSDSKAVRATIKLDSQLAQRQLIGEYKVKESTLKTFFERVKTLENEFASVTYVHILRDDNKVADKLANNAMDKRE